MNPSTLPRRCRPTSVQLPTLYMGTLIWSHRALRLRQNCESRLLFAQVQSILLLKAFGLYVRALPITLCAMLVAIQAFRKPMANIPP